MSEAGLFQRLLDESAAIASVEVGADGTVQATNGAFAEQVGASRSDIAGSPVTAYLARSDGERVIGWIEAAGASPESPSPESPSSQESVLPDGPTRMNFIAADGSPFTLRCLVGRAEDGIRIVGEPESRGDRSAAQQLMEMNNELATMARERARRERELERTRKELQAALDDLRTSYWHLQKIQEVLPLCMRCGKVKTAEAEWQSVVEYLKANEIFLSHGYCPVCADVVEREFGLEDE